jgi:serine protein kinase
MDRTIAKIMRYLHSASLRGEESRQILLLMGPVGAGKSALLEHIKRALELSAPVYHIKDCPIREEPLHLIPRSLRPAFEEKLGVKIEGDLCPICRWRLKNEYDGKYEAMPVAMTGFSTRARKGVGVVPPVDANTQDTSLLIGTEDISKLDKYSEDDPRVLSLNGAFNVGNRGMVELVEVFKNEIEFLHTVITATQEKSIPAPGKHSMIYFDGVIIAHCNEAEWNRFKSTHTNEAILDRIVPIYVPYSLELNEEVKIYTKQLGRSDFKAHVAPHTIELASMFSVMSRLKQTEKCDPLIKMKIYNGDEVTEKGRAKKIDIKDLREEARHEGMTGISTRFIMKAIDNALSDSDRNMITPISVRDSLIKQVKESTLPDEERTRYLALLQKTVYDEYLKILEKEIAKAFVSSFSEQAETLFQNYIDNVEAYVNRTMVKDAVTREEINPDETFMRSIEEQIGITGTARDGFRSDITSYMMRALRRKEKLTYDCYAPLKEAIEAKLIFSVREMSRIVTKAKSRDDKQQRKYGDVVKTLIDTYGYNEDSAEEILKFAANHLWRDS